MGCATSKGAFLEAKPLNFEGPHDGHDGYRKATCLLDLPKQKQYLLVFQFFFCWRGRRRNGFIRGVVRTRNIWPNISKR